MPTRLVCNLFDVPKMTTFEAFLIYNADTLGKPYGGTQGICSRLSLFLKNRLRITLDITTEECLCHNINVNQTVFECQKTLDEIKKHYHKYDLKFSLQNEV
jgi:hypothetical protein